MKPPRCPAERPVPDDDLALFHAAVVGATPLRHDNRVKHAPPKPRPQPRQSEFDEQAALNESLHGTLDIDGLLDLSDVDAFLRPGLPRLILRDLRRGR